MSFLPREHEIAPTDFVDHYLTPREPVVITGEVLSWPAFHKWTWDYLVDRLGEYEVDIYDDWFQPTSTSTFRQFVEANVGGTGTWKQRYVRWFSQHHSGNGRWADDVFAALKDDWYAPRFLPSSGYVVPLAMPPARIDPVTDRFPYRALLISGAGARTRLHLDPWASSAVLCQVVGDKRVTLWPPAQHDVALALSKQGASGERCNVPPTYDDMLHAGEVLFVPAGWWHEVDTVTDAVSVTWNFVYKTHLNALRSHVASFPDDPELNVLTYFT